MLTNENHVDDWSRIFVGKLVKWFLEGEIPRVKQNLTGG